jgi:hypothetical protein
MTPADFLRKARIVLGEPVAAIADAMAALPRHGRAGAALYRRAVESGL